MSDAPETAGTQVGAGDAWRQVGNQLESLGQSLASAFRAALKSEETQHHVQELQTGFESMVNQVHRAIQDTAASPEGQQFQAEVEQAVRSARFALNQAAADVQRAVERVKETGAPKDSPE